ncbi:MAG: PhnA domain-containing protein [Alphaproteobacteria bacterium]|nr:PhnA domain-containing protein [Alphaproteobacteria bacterium]
MQERSGGACELCGATEGLRAVEVPPVDAPTSDRAVLLCPTCADGLTAPDQVAAAHWFCLQESAWSQTPAVQVTAWRLLQGLREHGWARDLLDTLYVDDDTLAWARAGLPDPSAVPTVDSNGTVLQDGDSVTLIKDLPVKGAGFTAKRGTLVKGIRLTGDPGLVEGKVDRVEIFLKTEFLKKA